jgi:unconventional prefoldin RPB5 interactor 1
MDDSGLLQVERQRRELEDNISKLRKSLQHWQTWEIEYEGLREEIAGLPDGSNEDEILAIAREFRAELVDEKELQTIVGRERRSPRSQAQIVELLGKRVDYVSQNARTVEKQLSEAQKKRNALLLAEEPDYREDAGLPLTDITEELDDNGNIVASRVETPGSTAPKLVDVLKKAGVKDLLEQGGIVTASEGLSCDVAEGQHNLPEEETRGTTTAPRTESVHEGSAPREQPSKSLVIDTKLRDEPIEGKKNAKAEDRRGSKTPEGDRVTASEGCSTLSSAQKVSVSSQTTKNGTENPDRDQTNMNIQPTDSPEEAALRREMLRYGLGEVGSIVAELDLEDNGSEVSYDEEGVALSFDSDLDEDILEDDESEDEHGMVKHPALSKKYLDKIKELEEKHGIEGMQNLGPDVSKLPKKLQGELDRPSAAAAARKAALARETEAEDGTVSAIRQNEKGHSRPKKKVAFAESLDIASEDIAQAGSKSIPKNRPEALNLSEPVKDSVVERQSSVGSADKMQPVSQAQSRKPSKFKAAREATPQTPLLPPSPNSPASNYPSITDPKSMTPPHNIHASRIVERDTTTNPQPPDPNDLDESIHRQEIASEYYKLRNRMIQRQGGFVSEGQADNYGEEMTPLPMIDEDGKEKKISRFKAARLK